MKYFIAFALTFSFFSACDKPSENPADPHAKEVKTDDHAHDDDHAHAPKDFEPGTHADWCGEHQVQESMCTRCNKTLIAGFKATGDWCDKHQLPNSQCLACNPDLKIVRPPKK